MESLGTAALYSYGQRAWNRWAQRRLGACISACHATPSHTHVACRFAISHRRARLTERQACSRVHTRANWMPAACRRTHAQAGAHACAGGHRRTHKRQLPTQHNATQHTPWLQMRTSSGVSPSLANGYLCVCAVSYGVVPCGVVPCGVVQCGAMWCHVVWYGVVWCGAVWCGIVWCCVASCCAVLCRVSVCLCVPAFVCEWMHGCMMRGCLEDV